MPHTKRTSPLTRKQRHWPRIADLLHTYPLSRQVFLERDIRRLAPGLADHPNAVYNYLLEELGPKSRGEKLPTLGQVSIAEMGTYMQHTLLRDTDQMSMAHALEVRVPFPDHNVVAAALSVSDEDKWPHSPSNCSRMRCQSCSRAK